MALVFSDAAMAAALPRLNRPVNSLKGIGRRFSDRFSDAGICTLHQLAVRTASNSRANNDSWLSQILANARPNECVGAPWLVANEQRRHRVDRINSNAWNSVVRYLKAVSQANAAVAFAPRIPLEKQPRRLVQKRPRQCRV